MEARRLSVLLVALVVVVAGVGAAALVGTSVADDTDATEAAATDGAATLVAAEEDDGHSHGSAESTDAAPTAGESRNPDHALEDQPDEPLDVATRELLGTQLGAARAAALRFPTVADAQAAGCTLAGKFTPGAGAHYQCGYSLGFDVNNPMTWLYDGIGPTSQVVGVMYYAMADGQPEGFAGPNDHWHRHTGICIRPSTSGLDVPFPADADVTREMCDSVDGQYIAQTGWMLHAWVIDGWPSKDGVFSHDNPGLYCADGTTDTDEVGFCAGSESV